MTPDHPRGRRFGYGPFDVVPSGGGLELTCHYRLDDLRFTERFLISAPQDRCDVADRSIQDAARLVHLLAGVSYYKTRVPPVVDLGELEANDAERRLLRAFYLEGLAEMAYRHQLDLGGTRFDGGRPASGGPGSQRRPPVGADRPRRPLIPFGGGIDSIVTVEDLRAGSPRTTLLVVAPMGAPLQAIEAALAVADLPVLRVQRQLDPQVLRSAELGFWNGHVPVTGIISAVAVMAAVLGGHDSVVMSNEWSASIGNLVVDGRTVNHQWSKGLDFEKELRSSLAGSLRPGIDYYSLLRPYSELWVARKFAALGQYHRVFRSCNRAFHIDRARRLDHWCGTCDKCCFTDLILAPFLSAAELSDIFDGHEPLANGDLESRFRALLGLRLEAKPFECVGDVEECRAALFLAAARPDRNDTPLLHKLVAEVGPDVADPAPLFGLMGEHFIPDADTPQDQLV